MKSTLWQTKYKGNLSHARDLFLMTTYLKDF